MLEYAIPIIQLRQGRSQKNKVQQSSLKNWLAPPHCQTSCPPYFSHSNYSFRPLFSQAPIISFRPLILQIKHKVGPLTFKNTKIQTLTTNSHFLHLKNPPHGPHKIPCSFLFFVFSDPLPNIAYQPPKLNSISPLSFSPKKKIIIK